MHNFTTAGTKYLSQTIAKATNKYSDAIIWMATAPFSLWSAENMSFGKSSIAGGVQVIEALNLSAATLWNKITFQR